MFSDIIKILIHRFKNLKKRPKNNQNAKNQKEKVVKHTENFFFKVIKISLISHQQCIPEDRGRTYLISLIF